jgi:hypothetical protein
VDTCVVFERSERDGHIQYLWLAIVLPFCHELTLKANNHQVTSKSLSNFLQCILIHGQLFFGSILIWSSCCSWCLVYIMIYRHKVEINVFIHICTLSSANAYGLYVMYIEESSLFQLLFFFPCVIYVLTSKNTSKHTEKKVNKHAMGLIQEQILFLGLIWMCLLIFNIHSSNQKKSNNDLPIYHPFQV